VVAVVDRVEDFLAQWRRERPDLDTTPMGVLGRLSRVEEMLGRELRDFFAGHGLQPGEFDLLATLRRDGAPYTLTPSGIASASMVTPAAVTNRLNRLEAKGLVRRATDPGNRRTVRVTLTAEGLALVDDVVVAHLDNERRLLTPLSSNEQARLAQLLARLLEGHGDTSTQAPDAVPDRP